jgi:hypothetical protein
MEYSLRVDNLMRVEAPRWIMKTGVRTHLFREGCKWKSFIVATEQQNVKRVQFLIFVILKMWTPQIFGYPAPLPFCKS